MEGIVGGLLYFIGILTITVSILLGLQNKSAMLAVCGSISGLLFLAFGALIAIGIEIVELLTKTSHTNTVC